MIIGVVGTFASGKDTVADYLAEAKGFFHVSTGDLVRVYVRDNGLGDTDRDTLRRVANELRGSKGSGYLVEQALLNGHPLLVISGIRAVGEAEALHAAGGHLVAVDAPIESRYAWAKGRGRIGDEITFEYFKHQELAEWQNAADHGQRIFDVIAMADFDIANDGSLQDLHDKVDEILKRITPREDAKA